MFSNSSANTWESSAAPRCLSLTTPCGGSSPRRLPTASRPRSAPEARRVRPRRHPRRCALGECPHRGIQRRPDPRAKVRLPNSLTEIGLTVDSTEELRAVAEAATPDETIHNMPFEVTPELVVQALVAIEGISRRVRADHGLPEPVLYVAKH